MARADKQVENVTLPRSGAKPVLGGHPWVFRDVKVNSPAGAVVALNFEERVIAWGLADEGPIAVRVLGRGAAPADPMHEIAERIRRADGVRFRLVDGETDCWRAVNGEGDGLPGLIVDRYGDLAVLRLYSKAWEPWLDAIVGVIAGLPWVSCVARRLGVANVDGQEGLIWMHGGEIPDVKVVQEHGVKLLVRPFVGQKTGMFLDQREHRRIVGRLAYGRDVLNLFAYHGGFSVHAALGGAARVTTVDLAPEAIADAAENFRLNGLDPDQHAFEVADVFNYRPKGRPDLLIVDPPSLAHGKAAERSAGHAYRKLHKSLGGYIPRDGLLATSSCTSRLTMAQWKDSVREGLADHGDWSWHWQSNAPTDHPVSISHLEGEYLKFAVLRRR